MIENALAKQLCSLPLEHVPDAMDAAIQAVRPEGVG